MKFWVPSLDPLRAQVLNIFLCVHAFVFSADVWRSQNVETPFRVYILSSIDCLQLYIHQNFFTVFVNVIIIDQWNQTASLYEIQVTVIYSRAILVTVTSECRVKRVICKTWMGHWQTVKTHIRRHRTRRLIMVCTVCLNHRKVRVKWNSVKSSSRIITHVWQVLCCGYRKPNPPPPPPLNQVTLDYDSFRFTLKWRTFCDKFPNQTKTLISFAIMHFLIK